MPLSRASRRANFDHKSHCYLNCRGFPPCIIQVQAAESVASITPFVSQSEDAFAVGGSTLAQQSLNSLRFGSLAPSLLVSQQPPAGAPACKPES